MTIKDPQLESFAKQIKAAKKRGDILEEQSISRKRAAYKREDATYKRPKLSGETTVVSESASQVSRQTATHGIRHTHAPHTLHARFAPLATHIHTHTHATG